jgi:DNA segregation ATPase FtsK/SpoIIIE-like protein
MLDDDELYEDAAEVAIKEGKKLGGKISPSVLVRHLGVSYDRASHLLELLEKNGLVSPTDGQHLRDVLVPERKSHKSVRKTHKPAPVEYQGPSNDTIKPVNKALLIAATPL